MFEGFVNGIPVQAAEARVVTDKTTGLIRYISTTFYADLGFPKEPRFSEYDAIKIAAEHLSEQSGLNISSINSYTKKTRLFYRRVWNGTSFDLKLNWEVEFIDPTGELILLPVLIDAMDGKPFIDISFTHASAVNFCDGNQQGCGSRHLFNKTMT